MRNFIKYKLLKIPLIPFLYDLLYAFKYRKQMVFVIKDYFSFKKSLSSLKICQDKLDCKNPKNVLIVPTLSDMIYEAKMLGGLALGPSNKGAHISVLTHRWRRWQNRTFKSFGIKRFLYLEDFAICEKTKMEISKIIEKFFENPLNFQDVKKWTYRGAKIGPVLLSNIQRQHFNAAPDPADPFISDQLKSRLPQVIETVHVGEILFKKEHFDLTYIIEINGSDVGPMIFSAIAKGFNVVQVVQPNRDDALVLKRLTPESKDFHPNSISSGTMKRLVAEGWNDEKEKELSLELNNRYNGKWFLQSRNQPDVEEKSKDELISELDLDSNLKIAVVFSHVLWDANLFYGEDLFEDYSDWFVETVKMACENKNINWIIKLHPANIWKRALGNVDGEYSEISLINDHIGNLPSHVHLLMPDTKVSTFSLFSSIDYAVTVRGTSGIESPIFGIKTLTAGTGRYSGLGFTDDSKTKEEYLSKLLSIHTMSAMSPNEIMMAKHHGHAIFKRRPWVMESFVAEFNYLKKGNHLLDHNLFINKKKSSSLKDLSRWADWALDKKETDYMEY